LVNLSVYDVSGKIISTILNKDLTEGNYEFNFKSGNLPSGVYYYKLTAGDFSEVKSMMLIK